MDEQIGESPVPESDEIIQNCVDNLSVEQEQFAQQMAESLDALEAYQNSLDEWQSELVERANAIALREQQLGEQRKLFIQQQATDVAMTAELDQVRAEVDELRQHLTVDVALCGVSATAVTNSLAKILPVERQPSGERVEASMNSVAKQFHKLRQQQAARRTSARPGESLH